jgi:hypothetical protein
LDIPLHASGVLVARTYPFLALRMAVYFGIAAAFTVAAGGGASLGWAVGAIAGVSGRVPGAFWGAIAGIAVVALMLHWLREYLLFLVKAGHLGAIVRMLDRRPGADGIGQLGPAIDAVQRGFRGIDELLAIDRLVGGALNDFAAQKSARTLGWTDARLPPSLIGIARRVAFACMREIVLASILRAPGRNAWREARDALVLFAQNHLLLLKPALVLAAATYCAAFLAFLIALLPARALAQNLPGDPVVIALILAIIYAWCFRQALLVPLASAALLLIYIRATADQSPDAEWESKLAGTSPHFRELTTRGGTRRGDRRSRIA